MVMAMRTSRQCEGTNASGQACNQAPLRDSHLCFWHDPEQAEEAAQARRLGGVRRRRESVVQGTYELDGLSTAADLQRLLMVTAVDALALENSVGRVRALTAIVLAGARVL